MTTKSAEIIIFKLADKNATIDQAVTAANDFGEHGLIEGGFATADWGELKTGPNSTLEGSFDFAEPGGYVYYCFIETHGGHWNYGMVGKILLVGTGCGVSRTLRTPGSAAWVMASTPPASGNVASISGVTTTARSMSA